MKITWNKQPKSLMKDLNSDIKSISLKVVEAMGKEVEQNARRNFARAINDISGDNPFVEVSRTSDGKSTTIKCSGEQVLFAEFGAGIENSYYEKEIEVKEHTATIGNTTYLVKAHSRTVVFNAKGFGKYGMKEKAPRPMGIDKLGHYHLSRYSVSMGRYPFWIRSTKNGHYSPTMESKVRDKPNLIWTTGTRPIRALWRARNNARTKLLNGRLNIK